MVALGLGQVFGIKMGHTLGIFAGSMTSTATLQAALDVMHNSEPSIGYSIAYPFGVIGPILCIYFMTRRVQPKFPPKAQRFHMGEMTLGDNCAGRTLAELSKDLPAGVQVTMVRKGGQNVVPSTDMVLAAGDGLLIVAERQDAIAEAAARLGRLEPGRIVKDRSALDYIRVFVGKANLVGVPLCAAAAAGRVSGSSPACPALRHGPRSDPDLTLEFGDRVGVLDAARPQGRRAAPLRRHREGDRGVQLRVARPRHGAGRSARLIPIPIPGVGTVTLGIGGGPLIVALIVGKLRRTGPLLWVMPLPANIVLRNFGLAIFLAAVGINAGQPFVRTVSETGLTMLLIGAAVLLTTVLIVLLVGYYLLKIPYDDLVGVASGATGNPAILVYSTRMAPTERPDIGYAMIFPSMTIVKVIAVQIVGLLVATGAG